MTLYAFPPSNATVRPSEGMHTPVDKSTPMEMNFVPTVQQVATHAPVVTQQVSVTPVASRSDLLAEPAEWTWQEFRDYVVAQIEAVSGPFPRDSRKEYGIFNRFLKEYGQDGIRVARYAFETCGGWWNGAPISVTRFAKGSDPYFVAPILDRLAGV